jgi:hypothetical protein
MQRSFSKELEEDREFEIGGEVFRWMFPHWKDGAKLFDDEMQEVAEQTEGEASNGNRAFSFVADTETAIKRVPLFLDPDFNDAHARWKSLMTRKPPHAVPRHQIAQCYRWLVEVTSGFPTNLPSGSGSGATESDTPSAESES